ncbi:hypothetical protein E2I00_017278, partial [Balaenoptera physalus]
MPPPSPGRLDAAPNAPSGAGPTLPPPIPAVARQPPPPPTRWRLASAAARKRHLRPEMGRGRSSVGPLEEAGPRRRPEGKGRREGIKGVCCNGGSCPERIPKGFEKPWLRVRNFRAKHITSNQHYPTRLCIKSAKENKKKKDPSKGRWVEGITSEGYHYHYDLIKGASQWEKPEGFQGNVKKTAVRTVWVEGLSEDGYTYYYNTETGESRWGKPDDFIPHSGDLHSSKVNEKSLGTQEESKSSDSR